MAVRYVRRVQLGAYMSRKGLNIVKTSSKKGSCHLWLEASCGTRRPTCPTRRRR